MRADNGHPGFPNALIEEFTFGGSRVLFTFQSFSLHVVFILSVKKSALTYRVNSATCMLVFSLLAFQTSPGVQTREGEKMKEAVTIRLTTDAGLTTKNSRGGGSRGAKSNLIHSFLEKKLSGRLSQRSCEEIPALLG